jgi:hypothetical protein
MTEFIEITEKKEYRQSIIKGNVIFIKFVNSNL